MTQPAKSALCPDDRLEAVTTIAPEEGRRKLNDLDLLLRDYPKDARLHFLKGSWLASDQHYTEAIDCISRALLVAPDYNVARFQLGLLHLTSGDARAALEDWGPLSLLPAGHFLRYFADGLSHLIRDEFEEAVISLEKGIACNQEVSAMNRDMQLVVDEIRAKTKQSDGRDAPISSVGQLLQQAALKTTRH